MGDFSRARGSGRSAEVGERQGPAAGWNAAGVREFDFCSWALSAVEGSPRKAEFCGKVKFCIN